MNSEFIKLKFHVYRELGALVTQLLTGFSVWSYAERPSRGASYLPVSFPVAVYVRHVSTMLLWSAPQERDTAFVGFRVG
jgi:hypothetical protein